MRLVNSSSFYNISNTKTNKQHNVQNKYVALAPLKNDVFFNGIKKTYDMDKANTEKDIPENANIFITSPKTKVKFPDGFTAKEIIQTTKGMSWYQRNISGEDANKIELNNANIEYAHGLTGEKILGAITLNNSHIDQIEDVTTIEANNNSSIDYIDKVDTLRGNDSTFGTINIRGCAILKNSTVNEVTNAVNVATYPGVKINKVNSELLNCKADDAIGQDVYTQIGDAKVESASIDQAKIKGTLNTHELVMKNSFAKKLTADYCLSYENSSVDDLTMYNVRVLEGCKAKKFTVSSINPSIAFNNQTQIDELNFPEGSAKLFINNEKRWDKPLDNYIKKINVTTNKYIGGVPVIKIQGGINIEEINFKDTPGIVEFTKAQKYCPNVKINNGTAKYCVPTELPPTDNDFEN